MIVAFEHVGSTALPGMTAVPTIEVLAGVLEVAGTCGPVIDLLTDAGWEYRPEVGTHTPNRRFFDQPPGPNHRSFQLHIVEFDSPQCATPSPFGTLFCNTRKPRNRYLELKRSLPSRLYENPSDYSTRKTELDANVLARATSC